ncbi:hypothetical protein BT93_L4790 [Corymbia citriodora subsp. variegata]|uniref:Enoyl reductase (ER) domain-containing protein n=1 Tax=Corymbia citriodora subsp. variegata TaxID=360336 RepID=A0A8T0CJE8_CORYI|nr:hypothetical protein BT93_L4790 [Corymbia citriodora subsp. variegata]
MAETAQAPQIPTHHKAIVYDKPGEISTKIETVETPKPGNGEVLLKMTHSGVCHSDQAVMANRWPWLPAPTQAGQIGGHEGVGEVVALGPGTENSGLKIGQRAGIKWMSSACGNCLACLCGRDGCCLNGKISGYYTPGTFQQYAIGPAHYVTPIPDGVPSDLAAPLLCAGVTVYAALRKTGAQPGDSVVIAGAGGGLGHLAVQCSRAMGFRTIGIDSASKEEFVMGLGCEKFFSLDNYSRDDEGSAKLIKDVRDASQLGLGAVGVVVCTAANAAYTQALPMLRFGGTLVAVGIPEGAVPQPISKADPATLLAQELTIRGSAVGNRKDALETMDLAKRGLLKTYFEVQPMSALTDVFNRMEAMTLKGRVVIDLQSE